MSKIQKRKKPQLITVRDSTPTEEAVDRLVKCLQRPVINHLTAITNEYVSPDIDKVEEWIHDAVAAVEDVVYQEALSRIGAKALRR